MRIKKRLIAVVLVASCSGTTAWAQQAQQLYRQNRYTEAIAAAMGSRTTMDGLSTADLMVVGVAHMQRAYLLQALAALQADVGQQYYAMRLTNKEVTPSPYTAYFLGRHLFELDRCDQAAPHFEASFDKARLPDEYRRRARVWAAACQALQGQAQQADAAWKALTVDNNAALAGERAYARWKAGRVEIPVCGTARTTSVAEARCGLWASLEQENTSQRATLQQHLLADALPDQETNVEGDFTLRFYDPATLDILARADFLAAMEAFSRLEDTRQRTAALLLAGISAYEARRYEQARAYLEQTDQPRRDVYLGALDYLDGDQGGALQRWTQARAGNDEAEIEWIAVASDPRFANTHELVRAALLKYQRAPNSQRAARQLGRALLTMGLSADALDLLEETYPLQYNNELDKIEPGYLVTLAHAKFLEGRAHYPAVRSHLASLVDAYPIAEGVRYLTQAYTIPERTTGKVRTGN